MKLVMNVTGDADPDTEKGVTEEKVLSLLSGKHIFNW